MKYLESKIMSLGVGISAYGAYDKTKLGSYAIIFIVAGIFLVSMSKEIAEYTQKGNK